MSASACRSASKRASTECESMPGLISLRATLRLTGSICWATQTAAHAAFADLLQQFVTAVAMTEPDHGGQCLQPVRSAELRIGDQRSYASRVCPGCSCRPQQSSRSDAPQRLVVSACALKMTAGELPAARITFAGAVRHVDAWLRRAPTACRSMKPPGAKLAPRPPLTAHRSQPAYPFSRLPISRRSQERA